MTLYEVKAAAARYLEHDVTDLTQNDIDLGLIALNQVREVAEQSNDFNFTRKLLLVSVDGVTGGSLDTAVEYGTTEPLVEVKTIVDVGTFDADGNFRPVEWTTIPDSFNRVREDNPRYVPRYPTDAQAVCGPIGQRRFTFSGGKVFYFPRTPNLTIQLGIEAYTFTPDWTSNDVTKDATDVYDGPWNKHGAQYLQWASVIHLNQLFKGFVFRQEGNLPPPQQLADAGLAALQTWDNFMYEQFRRHDR